MGMKRMFIILLICLGSWGYEEEGDDIGPMEKTERDALFSVLAGFLGNLWDGPGLFPDPCGWSPIPGVVCDFHDGFWYVGALYLSTQPGKLACDSNAELRQEIFQLKYLKTLSISNCFTSPKQNHAAMASGDWLNLAPNLEALELRSNPGITAEIPTIFGTLTNLQSMVLSENGFVGEIPESFGKLVKLKQLILAGNSLTGGIPPALGELNDLIILDLSRNQLSSLPPEIGNLTSLLKLDLCGNRIAGNIPGEISGLRNLTLLDLGGNRFSGGLRPSFEKMESLQHMVLSGNPVGGTLAGVDWKSLRSLLVLDLADMGLEGEIPESLSEMKNLRYLGLNRNNLTGTPPAQLATMPSVTAMYLYGNNFSGDLKFPDLFYGRLRRRFGAWDNPNLCYWMVSANNTPFGVKPCRREVMLTEMKSDAGGRGNAVASGAGVEGSRWEFVFPVKALMTVLLLLNHR